MDEGRVFVGAAIWSERESKDRLVRGTRKLVEDDDCDVRAEHKD